MEREHILREIKRTAEENGGKPLGVQRFEAATGVKPHEWGKYWSAWSDALGEAGYAPNEWNRPYDDLELLEKYAQLAHELGRLPVKNDIRIKAHCDRGFPSIGPFERLGGKTHLVRLVQEYCRNRECYEDVIRMCQAYTPPKREASAAAGDRNAKIGFVYLMKSGRFYKIGHSDAPGRRQYAAVRQ